MPNYLSEDDIEQALVQRLQHEYGYDALNCETAEREDLNDGSGRTDKREVIMKDRLREAAIRLNPEIPETAIDDALRELCDQRQVMTSVAANREVDGLIRHGIRVAFKDESGRDREDRVRVIDFNDAEANEFLAMTQLWIEGETRYRRPDVILYVNGLPLVFIELKNSNVKLKTAYTDNLANYREDIPQLFVANAFCVLSNGIETRVGSMTAGWEHFFHWLRPEEENEKIRKEEIREAGTSVERFLQGLCPKAVLLDYIENFILFYKESQKIVAQNHQFLGVNRGYRKFLERGEHGGKLGVFWHTQGSGKSFSMIFYARKVFRKCEGNYTFVVVTDRLDLDGQIYRNFLHTGTVTEKDAAQPKDSAEMRKFLGQNKRLVFTLIQKFSWPAGSEYPLLSDRDDIIVIVDEAHRSQYKSLAENMRAGLPKAQYLAFTGTPLLGRDRKTNEWFGDYVSEYNFSQSMNDGATVPLFYKKRVPEVIIQNDDLSEEFYEILEDEDLDDTQQAKLENLFAQEMEVIKRDDRLEKIAEDIVYHFPRRGYLGKAMVITVDKFTAVIMYDKVQALWKAEIKKLTGRIKNAPDDISKARLQKRRDWMKRVDMAVVISEEAGEEEKFELAGLNIQPHRKRMNTIDDQEGDVEDQFKDPTNDLQLVFVCAMWLTGFDAPTVSTLYLDKPQKDHTLMQTIARANRVTPVKIDGKEKRSGEVVDYYGVFGRLKKALKNYGQGTEGGDEPPIRDKEELIRLLAASIEEAIDFCIENGVSIDKARGKYDTFKEVAMFEEWAHTLLARDELRKSFNVYANTIAGLYEAAKPEVLGKPEVRMVAAFQYLRGVIDSIIGQQDVESAAKRVSELLDESLVVPETGEPVVRGGNPSRVVIPQRGKVWDLSKIDFDKLNAEFKKATYKNIEIADLRAFLDKKLAEMMNQNQTRRDFAERLQEIIDRYNSGAASADQAFRELMNFNRDLKEEDERHIRLGLSEDELELFDLLKKKQMTKDEEQKVRLAAKALLERLTEESPRLLVQGWFKNQQTRLQVKSGMEDVLNEHLPESYDTELFQRKRDRVFEHTLDLAINHRKWAA